MDTHREVAETTEATSERCLNCNVELAGAYCYNCGQKKIHRHELALKHFFGHLVHEFSHLDTNKITKTFSALLLRPGLLTAEYLAGRKGNFINPIRLYLTFSAIYFLFAWGALSEVRGGGVRTANRSPRLVAMAQKKGMESQALGEKIYQKAEKYSACCGLPVC